MWRQRTEIGGEIDGGGRRVGGYQLKVLTQDVKAMIGGTIEWPVVRRSMGRRAVMGAEILMVLGEWEEGEPRNAIDMMGVSG